MERETCTVCGNKKYRTSYIRPVTSGECDICETAERERLALKKGEYVTDLGGKSRLVPYGYTKEDFLESIAPTMR